MGKTVLIVEDDPDNLEALADLLLEEGYDVITARSGREACQRLSRSGICLVLVDYLLPDATGLDVFKLVRAHAQHRDVPVVILTAATHEQMEEMNAPVLKKPIALEELLAAVRAHCGRADDRGVPDQVSGTDDGRC